MDSFAHIMQTDGNNSLSALKRVCLTAMAVCLVIEGAILLISGFPFPGLPTTLYVTGTVWLILVIATVFAVQRPLFPVVVGLAMFTVETAAIQNNQAGKAHSIGQFLYQHSIELVYLIFSVSLLLIVRHGAVHRRRETN